MKSTAAISSRTSGAEWSFADIPDRCLSKRRQSGLQGDPSPVSPFHGANLRQTLASHGCCSCGAPSGR
jgi:hypothetical protein